MDCSGSCRDLTSDPEACGACGTACAAGELCSAGQCVLSCQQGLTNCNDTCRDLQTDESDCGACGTVCPSGSLCSGGTCSVSCQSGLTLCGATCRDLQTDNSNCGACGTVCPVGDVCSGSNCVLTCQSGLTNCNNSCRDLQNDRLNCNSCGNACPAGQTCSSGACVTVCTGGQTNCSGVCRDIANDELNCGACGRSCAAGQSCVSGNCQSDTCEAAPAVVLNSIGTTTITGNTTGMTTSVGACGGGPDVFLAFTLTQREIVYVDTFGSTWDTRVGFIAGACGTAATSCNDDSCASLQSQSVAVLPAGTYRIVIGGYQAGNYGPFTLHIQHQPVVGSPVNLLGTTFSYTGTTVGSTNGQTTCNGGGPDKFYYYNSCPSTPVGTFTAHTCFATTSYDSVLAFKNAANGTGACNDDGGSVIPAGGTTCGVHSIVTTSTPAGAGLHVLWVDGYGTSSGTYQLAGSHP